MRLAGIDAKKIILSVGAIAAMVITAGAVLPTASIIGKAVDILGAVSFKKGLDKEFKKIITKAVEDAFLQTAIGSTLNRYDIIANNCFFETSAEDYLL